IIYDMAKRANPFVDDFIPQSKVHVGIKQFNNNQDRLKQVDNKLRLKQCTCGSNVESQCAYCEVSLCGGCQHMCVHCERSHCLRCIMIGYVLVTQ
ncbi:hypothetical protein HW555_008876, partial [Spodoptera exigua]